MRHPCRAPKYRLGERWKVILDVVAHQQIGNLVNSKIDKHNWYIRRNNSYTKCSPKYMMFDVLVFSTRNHSHCLRAYWILEIEGNAPKSRTVESQTHCFVGIWCLSIPDGFPITWSILYSGTTLNQSCSGLDHNNDIIWIHICIYIYIYTLDI